MISILLVAGTFVLILVSIFMVFVILMQRPSTSGGLGTAFGGGAAEQAFGAETTNILSRATILSASAFLFLTLLLYLGYMWSISQPQVEQNAALPTYAEAVEPEAETTPDAVTTEGETTVEASEQPVPSAVDAEEVLRNQAAAPTEESANEATTTETEAPAETPDAPQSGTGQAAEPGSTPANQQ